MGRTPDRRPGRQLEDDAIEFEDRISSTGVVGTLYRKGDDLFFHDSAEEENLRQAGGGGGLTEGQHQTLRQLIHFIDSGPASGFVSGAFHEALPSGNPFPTSMIWWESAAKLEKIVKLTITRNSNKTPSTEVWEMYDTDGTTVLATVTDTISYSGIIETTRTRTIA